MTRPGELAESFVAAISRHDPDAVARCFAADYEDEAPATFRWGRIYTELARSAGGIEAQLARMTGDGPPP